MHMKIIIHDWYNIYEILNLLNLYFDRDQQLT